MLWHHQTPDVSGSVSCGVWQMACRRVIRVGERVVKEFTSQLPYYDLTRIVTELRFSPDSDQEQDASDKSSTDTSKSRTTPQKS